MLSERISALFELLQCSNTEIARYAGCSSGNISKLKTGNREPKPTSRSIAALVNGIYSYADYEKMMPVLAELCGETDISREKLVPALIAWLYESDEAVTPPRTVTPQTKHMRIRQQQNFGEKLDRVMTKLALSNGRLASMLSIDVSLVSRYRRGIYSPQRNERLSAKLAVVLLERAGETGHLGELAEMCGMREDEIDASAVLDWLYRVSEDRLDMAKRLLYSLDNISSEKNRPAVVPRDLRFEAASCYWGTKGLREAVLRFLYETSREGGELLLYSDEPMEWMTEDRSYFALWSSLMRKCVQNNVKIRIIHNVDRDTSEMIDGIRGWIPLYMSGMIEPFVFRRERNTRFCHTIFLRTGSACIHGFFPAGSGDDRWYDYVTDRQHLEALEHEYSSMLINSAPFLKTYTSAMEREFESFFLSKSCAKYFLVNELPTVTMPEKLMERMIARASIGDEEKASMFSFYRKLREEFLETLKREAVNMILCPLQKEERTISLGAGLTGISVEYMQEEYEEHVRAIGMLVENERHFHLTLVPEAPFKDIKIAMMKHTVAVLRGSKPYAAFVFSNSMLTESMTNYFSAMVEQNITDRFTLVKMLEKWLKPEQSE